MDDQQQYNSTPQGTATQGAGAPPLPVPPAPPLPPIPPMPSTPAPSSSIPPPPPLDAPDVPAESSSAQTPTESSANSTDLPQHEPFPWEVASQNPVSADQPMASRPMTASGTDSADAPASGSMNDNPMPTPESVLTSDSDAPSSEASANEYAGVPLNSPADATAAPDSQAAPAAPIAPAAPSADPFAFPNDTDPANDWKLPPASPNNPNDLPLTQPVDMGDPLPPMPPVSSEGSPLSIPPAPPVAPLPSAPALDVSAPLPPMPPTPPAMPSVAPALPAAEPATSGLPPAFPASNAHVTDDAPSAFPPLPSSSPLGPTPRPAGPADQPVELPLGNEQSPDAAQDIAAIQATLAAAPAADAMAAASAPLPGQAPSPTQPAVPGTPTVSASVPPAPAAQAIPEDKKKTSSWIIWLIVGVAGVIIVGALYFIGRSRATVEVDTQSLLPGGTTSTTVDDSFDLSAPDSTSTTDPSFSGESLLP